MGKTRWLALAFVCAGACGGDAVPTLETSPRAARLQALQLHAGPRYAFVGTTAENPALGFVVRVADERVVLSAGRSSVGLSWTGMGRAGHMRAPPAPTGSQIVRNRYHRRRGASEEWLVNGPVGLEQGFEITERPEGPGKLVLQVSIDGSRPRSSLGGQIALPDASGRAFLRYTDLYAHDAGGRPLAATMVAVGATIELHIDDLGAQYPLSIDPLLWFDFGRLEPTVAGELELFGRSAAASGDTVVLGAADNDFGSPGPGAAFVYVRSGDAWVQQAKLEAADGAPFDELGFAVAISGDTLVAGAPFHAHASVESGAAFVFVRSGNTWSQQAELLPSFIEISGHFGESVAIDGDTILIGARGNTKKTVYVFTRSGTTWTEVAELSPALPTLSYPWSVALSGDTAVVGDRSDDDLANNSGAAYVFTGAGATWTEQAKLTSPQALANANMGEAVSISGDTIVLGAPNALSGVPKGAAFVFTRTNSVWSQEARLLASDGMAGDELGYSVAVDGDIVAVGAPFHDALATDGGAGYIFTRSGGVWPEQIKLVPPDTFDGDVFGASVALSGDTAVLGGPQVGAGDEGAARVFRYVATGQACSDAATCPTGFCVDGVCCNEICGGDLGTDCLACTEALTGQLDGLCGVALDGVTCGSDGVFCNGPESCSSGVCTSEGDPCAPPSGDGDGDCADVCDEGSDSCSAPEPENAPCDDGLFCTTADHCESGVCTGSDPCSQSADGDADCAESCHEESGSCTAPDEEGASCVAGGICAAGQCLAPLAAACSDGATCASGHCTDGLCCVKPSCGAYRCGPAGDCVTACNDTSECQPGHQCSAKGTCEPLTDFSAGDGCSCRATGRRGDVPIGLGLGVAVFVLRRRRREQAP